MNFFYLNTRSLKSLFIISIAILINKQLLYSENISQEENDGNEYVIIGIPKEIKPLHFMPDKLFELVSSNEHGGKVKLFPTLDFHQVIFDGNHELYKITGGAATNISEKPNVPLLKELTIPFLFDRNEKKRQIFYAKQYIIPEGFSNSVPGSLLLEVIYEKSFRVKEGTKQYEDNLKEYRIKLESP